VRARMKQMARGPVVHMEHVMYSLSPSREVYSDLDTLMHRACSLQTAIRDKDGIKCAIRAAAAQAASAAAAAATAAAAAAAEVAAACMSFPVGSLVTWSHAGAGLEYTVVESGTGFHTLKRKGATWRAPTIHVGPTEVFAPCHFYFEDGGRTYALEDSDTLKYTGDGAIPGFQCDFTGDYYKGHPLEYGTVTPDEWVPWPPASAALKRKRGVDDDADTAELMGMLDEEITDTSSAPASAPASPQRAPARVPLARII